jgi:hypothetical protein
MGSEGPPEEDFDEINVEEYVPVDIPVTAAVRRKRRARVDPVIPELSSGSPTDISEYDIEEDEGANSGDGDLNGIKHLFRDDTWNTKYFTYDPKPKDFTGRIGTSQFFEHTPTILTLFELFWPFNLLRKIVMETNRYATHVLDAMGNTRGGVQNR